MMAGVARGDSAQDTGARSWLIAVAVVAQVAGILLLWPIGFLTAVGGLLVGSVVPALLLGLHNQRAQLRALLLGEYLQTSFLWLRRGLVLSAVILAALHGYRFALALERAVIS